MSDGTYRTPARLFSSAVMRRSSSAIARGLGSFARSFDSAASAASGSLSALAGDCTDTLVVSAAQSALTNQVMPVISQAEAAPAIVESVKAFAIKVGNEEATVAASPSATPADIAALSDDIQTLSAMPPSAADIASVQSNATAGGGGTSAGSLDSNPAGMLTVSGGTIVDRMNLLSANAAALQNSLVCHPPGSSGSGGGPPPETDN